MLTENELFDRYMQALGEARHSCQRLGRNADPTHLAPRGADYGNLRRALKNLEGSCRQISHFRADTRWIKLGIIYARAMRSAQVKFVGQKWAYFNELQKLFEMGERSMKELRTRRTGKMGMILPTQPTDWLIMPDLKIPQPPPFGSMH